MLPFRAVSNDPVNPASPVSIAGHFIVRQLSSLPTYLAKSETGRDVVLKPLDPDCLLQGRLHPSIYARLSRVRELAHPGVANLHGVDVHDKHPWLVWDYVHGTPIDQLVRTRKDPRQLMNIGRELLVAVDALHAVGIVHGAIRPGNVIVDPRDRVILTHLSPLLHDDPAVDTHATAQLLATLAAMCGTDLHLPVTNNGSRGQGGSAGPEVNLKQLRRDFAKAGEDGRAPAPRPDKPSDGTLRLRPILAAVGVMVLAVVVFVLLRFEHRAAPVSTPAPLQIQR